MGDMQAMAARFEEALKTGDFGKLTELTREYGTDDFIQEWPQSGERLSKESSIKLAENYPQMAGTTPSFSFISSMQLKKSAPMRSSLLT